MTAVIAPTGAVLCSPLSEATGGTAGLTMHLETAAQILLVGELDLEGADALRACVLAIAEAGSPVITLDVSGLTFVDPVGIGAFASLGRHLDKVGARLRIVRPLPHVRRLLAIARDIAPLGFDVVV